MKYKFEKIDDDITKLSYKDKEFEIKRDVELTYKLQSVYMRARTKMMLELSKEGITKKDLVIERKANGKTYYDNSNINELEKYYTEMAFLEIYDEISKKKENVTALMSEELCKFVKADDKTLDIKAAKPILKSALWILEARKLELKNINVSNSAINSGIKEIDILIATLSKYIDKI